MILKKGATSQGVTIRIIDSGDGTPETGVVFNTSGIDLWYRRENAFSVDITEAALSTPDLEDTWETGGFLHINDGYYRLDVPDAAFASAAGVDHVVIGGTVTGMIVIGVVVQLTDFDPQDAAALGSTSIASILTQIGTAGAGLTDLGAMSDAMKAEVQAEVVDALKEMGLILSSSTIETVTNQTNFIIPATDDAVDDNSYNDLTAVFIDGTDVNQVSVRSVINYTASTRSIQVDSAPDFTVTTSDKIILLSSSNARAVWNRVLTGATHNETSSAGRRIRGIQEFQGYEGGAIWIDTVDGVAGTTDFENGTVENPVDSIADALTISASLKLKKFQVAPGSTITLGATFTNKEMEGHEWTLALDGQDIGGTEFRGAKVSGIGTGTGSTEFHECTMDATTIPPGTHLIDCDLDGTITFGAAGTFTLDNCAHGSPAPSIIDFGSGLNASTLHMHPFHGALEIQNMGAGTGSYVLHLNGDGFLTFNANCSATSTVNIAGNWTITDNAGGAITVNEDARFDVNSAFNRQITDSVPADGTLFTREQALYMLLQRQLDFAIVGTTLTVFKVDGTTALYTLTLDDATNPTAAARAT